MSQSYTHDTLRLAISLFFAMAVFQGVLFTAKWNKAPDFKYLLTVGFPWSPPSLSLWLSHYAAVLILFISWTTDILLLSMVCICEAKNYSVAHFGGTSKTSAFSTQLLTLHFLSVTDPSQQLRHITLHGFWQVRDEGAWIMQTASLWFLQERIQGEWSNSRTVSCSLESFPVNVSHLIIAQDEDAFSLLCQRDVGRFQKQVQHYFLQQFVFFEWMRPQDQRHGTEEPLVRPT